ncbi:MAG: CrcB family protein [Clostridiaceae bacterium]
MNNLLVFVGAFFGTMARYVIFLKTANHGQGTFIANTIGVFLLGAIVGTGSSDNFYILIANGFLGSFTTFSALVWESQHKLHKGNEWDAILYLIFSVLVGLSSFIFARFVFGKL